jgi:hypothetical protein
LNANEYGVVDRHKTVAVARKRLADMGKGKTNGRAEG